MNFLYNLTSSLASAFTFLNPPDTTDTLSGMDLNLKEDELACYREIVNQILKHSQRIIHPTLAPSIAGKNTYALIFRQSESWAEVKRQFNELLQSQVPKERDVAQIWLQYIEELYVQQQRAREMRRSDVLASTKDIQMRMFNTIELQLRDPEILAQKNCHHLLSTLMFKWQKLWIFLEWPEVSLDSNRLYVQVQEPLNKKVELEKYVSYATKAIILVEETELKERDWPGLQGPERLKIVTSTKVNIQGKAYGPSSPHLQQRSASQVRITGANYPCSVGMTEAELSETACPSQIRTSITYITSIAQRIDPLVHMAIKEVNKALEKAVKKAKETQNSSF